MGAPSRLLLLSLPGWRIQSLPRMSSGRASLPHPPVLAEQLDLLIAERAAWENPQLTLRLGAHWVSFILCGREQSQQQ